eukprot:11680519-Alexandrium_andersonii.AAC.1
MPVTTMYMTLWLMAYLTNDFQYSLIKKELCDKLKKSKVDKDRASMIMAIMKDLEVLQGSAKKTLKKWNLKQGKQMERDLTKKSDELAKELKIASKIV